VISQEILATCVSVLRVCDWPGGRHLGFSPDDRGHDRHPGVLDPSGYTGATRRAVEGRERGAEPDTLVICGGIVSPARTGQGLAGELIRALRELAPAAGAQRVIAPVRRALKPQ
jgi:GNAT superfamily N-acetyltransferase